MEGGRESPDSFIKSGFCQVHTPCPLGPDRNRFLRLVEDIKSRRDDYAAQLGSLTLAGIATSVIPAEESERAIVRQLFGQGEGPAEERERERADRLWQARLVLAIGELLDHEEEEIAMHLATLEEEEKGLFQELQGEDESEEDNPFAELRQVERKLHGSHSGNLRKRFQAWRTLFAAAADLPKFPIVVTGSPDSGELLLELYEKQTGQPAPLVGELALPAFVGWNSAEAGQAVRKFAERHGELLARLGEALASLAVMTPDDASAGKAGSELQELAGLWEKAIDDDFPAERAGRIPVRISLFPNVSCSAILGAGPAAAWLSAATGILAIIG